VRYTRHAKNGARWLGVTEADVKHVLTNACVVDTDEDGNPRFTGWVKGKRIRIVLALDQPELIVTIHPRRKR
jgi:hypothetical protein